MRLGIALAPFVEPVTDDALRALDAFAARSAMPELVEVWSRWVLREWWLDRDLLRGIRERGAEPVVLMESTGVVYEWILSGACDTALRLQALRAEGCVVRWDQEPQSKGLGAPWYRHPLYVETFQYVSAVMRAEADVRLAYCSTSDPDTMAAFYPGDACQVVGFDAFSRAEFGRFPPDQWRLPAGVLSRLAPGKPVWVFECGRLVGLPKRAQWLRSMSDVQGVDVVCVWDMDVPDSPDDFTFTPSMRRMFGVMVRG